MEENNLYLYIFTKIVYAHQIIFTGRQTTKTREDNIPKPQITLLKNVPEQPTEEINTWKTIKYLCLLQSFTIVHHNYNRLKKIYK